MTMTYLQKLSELGCEVSLHGADKIDLHVHGCSCEQRIRAIEIAKRWKPEIIKELSQRNMEVKQKNEAANLMCGNCDYWKQVSFVRGLCTLTQYETSNLAHCKQVVSEHKHF